MTNETIIDVVGLGTGFRQRSAAMSAAKAGKKSGCC